MGILCDLRFLRGLVIEARFNREHGVLSDTLRLEQRVHDSRYFEGH